jgi:hypothetical protein
MRRLTARDTSVVSEADQIHRIVRPQPVAVRNVWPGEATHFTPWLADNLDWLEPLGLGPLELVGKEVALPEVNRNLDILAKTPDGRRIAIENQYLRTDHDHLTRGLAYAVGHHAKALVVISEDHGAEFVAIADYLNKAYEQLGQDEGIAVFLVTVSAEEIHSAIVPRFTVVSRPNTWLTAVNDDSTGAGTVEGFLESCTDAARPAAKAVLESWGRRSGASMRINPKSASVSLDYSYIPGQGRRSIFVLYGTGVMTVNRGYFIDIGQLSESEKTELDEALLQHFPTLNTKPYYPSLANPEPAQTSAFADWLIGWMSSRNSSTTARSLIE